MVAKGVGGEMDNQTRINRETRMDREIPKLRFYYINLRVVCAKHTSH
jgi:hypothetical protein